MPNSSLFYAIEAVPVAAKATAAGEYCFRVTYS